MAGLGLTNAVREFRRGYEWSTDVAEERKKRDEEARLKQVKDDAASAWRKRMTPPMIEVDGGLDDDGNPMPKIATPDPKWDRRAAVVDAMGDVADVYARNGEMNSFLTMEAKAAPLRAERRTAAIDKALMRYRVDKNPVNLVQSVYPYVYDGRKLTNAITRGGKIELSVDDGTKVAMTPDELVSSIEYMRDPKAAAEFEAKVRWGRIEAEIDAKKLKDVEATKHGNALGLAAVQFGNSAELERLRAQSQLGLADVNNASAERRAKIGAGATMGAAKIRAGADGEGGAAGLRLQSTRIDASGYMVGIFRDGTTKRLMIDGKPVRSSDYQRHISVLQKQLSESREGRRKTAEELRQQAEAMLLGGDASDGDDGEDFSHLWD